MMTLVIIFLIVSTIFALSTIGYVAVDIILEKRNREEPQEEQPPIIVPIPVFEPEPEPEPEPEVIPEIVEHIDAEEADALISDSLAMKSARYESGAGHGKQCIINIGDIDKLFEPNEIVTLAVLKQRYMIPKNVGRLKVLADGVLNKPLTVKAESYSVQAIKMIELTGGTVIILKD